MRSLYHLVIVALCLGVARPAIAQCPEDVRLRTERELEMTDGRIVQAVTILGESDNAMARLELRAAQELQIRARAEFTALHCRIATDLTLRARMRASRAIEIVRGGGGPPPGGGPDPGRVHEHLERTRDLLERARDRIEECNQYRARAMLRAAFEMQRRAEEAFAQGRGLAAHSLTVGARERALSALRMCNVHEGLHENAERALRRTDEVISRAQDAVADGDHERARKILRRAIELQERATLAFRARHFEASLRLTQSARTLAQRALRMSGSAPS